MDEEDTKPTTGLYCWVNSERECGSDCMAYQACPVEGADYCTPDGVPNQWARCMLLVNAHKVSKHVVLLASLARSAEHRASQVSPQQPVLPQVPR